MHAERRGLDGMSDRESQATLVRVRAEFDEMRCMRVTPEQAQSLLGLPVGVAVPVLDRLATDGFLTRTP